MLSVRPSKKLRKHLEVHGVRAKAAVVEISKRGSANLDQPSTSIGTADANPMTSWVRRKTRIRVTPEKGEAFDVEAKLTYRLIAEPQPGATIPVVYDPDDHSKIMVDEEAETRMIEDGGVESANDAIASAGYDPAAVWQAVSAAQGASPGTPSVDPELLDQAMRMTGMQGAKPAAPSSGSDSVVGLERLAELKRQGMLSEKEFEAAKKQLLGDG